MNTESQKAERLVALTLRLTQALEADIEALERGCPREMRTPQTDMQQLAMLYTREANAFGPSAIQALPQETRAKLTGSVLRFRELLAQHNRILTRVKTCSEGMIRAIAEDVAKKKGAQRPYSATPLSKPKSPGAILFNSVV